MKPIRFADYIWRNVRSSIILSWILIVAASLTIYIGLLVRIKGNQLRSDLQISADTANRALQAGDWPLALGHLQSFERIGHAFDIKMDGSSKGEGLAGPFGESPFGVGTVCASENAGGAATVSACIRVVGSPEVYTLGFFLAFALLLFVIALKFVQRKMLLFVKHVSDDLKSIPAADSRPSSDGIAIEEIETIRKHMLGLLDEIKRASASQALTRLSIQVAHDIRSPLAALDSVLRDVSELQEEKRLMIRGAAGRIRDIANHLIRTNQEMRGLDKGATVPAEPATIQLLSSIIEPLITEKRLQFRSKMGIEIDAPLDEASYGLFAQVAPGMFKRVLSNLVNNAVEALDDRGSVTIRLAAAEDAILLAVKDDGKGIPPEILPQLGQKGITHGKAGGSGLGLYHARASVEAWRGRLDIQSAPGEGTTVSIFLPKAPPPEWFVSKLVLPQDGAVVILDDDTSIHQVWQGRLTGAARERPVEIVHVSTPQEIRNWVGENPAKARKALYLLDYELLGYQETGLSVAAELGIGRQTILVTSRDDDPGILEDCRRLEARMVPKLLAALVPIEAASGQTRWDAVLIDDDPLARTTWRMTASRLGKRFRAFSTPAEFLAAAEEIDRGTPVYVDAELAGGVKGSTESRRIRDQGFAEVYLATGHDPAAFADLEHLSGVVGKEPPWS